MCDNPAMHDLADSLDAIWRFVRMLAVTAALAVLAAVGTCSYMAFGAELTEPSNRRTNTTLKQPAGKPLLPVAYGTEIATSPADPTDLPTYISQANAAQDANLSQLVATENVVKIERYYAHHGVTFPALSQFAYDPATDAITTTNTNWTTTRNDLFVDIVAVRQDNQFADYELKLVRGPLEERTRFEQNSQVYDNLDFVQVDDSISIVPRTSLGGLSGVVLRALGSYSGDHISGSNYGYADTSTAANRLWICVDPLLCNADDLPTNATGSGWASLEGVTPALVRAALGLTTSEADDLVVDVTVSGNTLTLTQNDGGTVDYTATGQGVVPEATESVSGTVRGITTVEIDSDSGADFRGWSVNRIRRALRRMVADWAEFDSTVVIPGDRLPDATFAGQGIVELATNSETESGTNQTRATTPSGVAQAISRTAGIDRGDHVFGTLYRTGDTATYPVGTTRLFMALDGDLATVNMPTGSGWTEIGVAGSGDGLPAGGVPGQVAQRVGDSGSEWGARVYRADADGDLPAPVVADIGQTLGITDDGLFHVAGRPYAATDPAGTWGPVGGAIGQDSAIKTGFLGTALNVGTGNGPDPSLAAVGEYILATDDRHFFEVVQLNANLRIWRIRDDPDDWLGFRSRDQLLRHAAAPGDWGYNEDDSTVEYLTMFVAGSPAHVEPYWTDGLTTAEARAAALFDLASIEDDIPSGARNKILMERGGGNAAPTAAGIAFSTDPHVWRFTPVHGHNGAGITVGEYGTLTPLHNVTRIVQDPGAGLPGLGKVQVRVTSTGRIPRQDHLCLYFRRHDTTGNWRSVFLEGGQDGIYESASLGSYYLGDRSGQAQDVIFRPHSCSNTTVSVVPADGRIESYADGIKLGQFVIDTDLGHLDEVVRHDPRIPDPGTDDDEKVLGVAGGEYALIVDQTADASSRVALYDSGVRLTDDLEILRFNTGIDCQTPQGEPNDVWCGTPLTIPLARFPTEVTLDSEIAGAFTSVSRSTDSDYFRTVFTRYDGGSRSVDIPLPTFNMAGVVRGASTSEIDSDSGSEFLAWSVDRFRRGAFRIVPEWGRVGNADAIPDAKISADITRDTEIARAIDEIALQGSNLVFTRINGVTFTITGLGGGGGTPDGYVTDATLSTSPGGISLLLERAQGLADITTSVDLPGFDLHDDVPGSDTAIASADRVVFSNEGSSGDPNAWATFGTVFDGIRDVVTTNNSSPATGDRIYLSDESGTGDPLEYTTVAQLGAVIGGGGSGFDLHNDVGTQIPVISLLDRWLVSAEGLSGDPNRYATSEQMRDYFAIGSATVRVEEGGSLLNNADTLNFRAADFDLVSQGGDQADIRLASSVVHSSGIADVFVGAERTGNTLTFDQFDGSTASVTLPTSGGGVADGVVDAVTPTFSGSDLTIELGRTEGLATISGDVTIPNATTVSRGLVELATQSEVNNGTGSHVVSADRLGGLFSQFVNDGPINIASPGGNSPNIAASQRAVAVAIADNLGGGGGGLTQAQVDARVTAGVADWAEDGNTDDVPATKLSTGSIAEDELADDDTIIVHDVSNGGLRHLAMEDLKDEVGGGVNVVANPTVADDDPEIESITIGATDYAIAHPHRGPYDNTRAYGVGNTVSTGIGNNEIFWIANEDIDAGRGAPTQANLGSWWSLASHGFFRGSRPDGSSLHVYPGDTWIYGDQFVLALQEQATVTGDALGVTNRTNGIINLSEKLQVLVNDSRVPNWSREEHQVSLNGTGLVPTVANGVPTLQFAVPLLEVEMADGRLNLVDDVEGDDLLLISEPDETDQESNSLVTVEDFVRTAHAAATEVFVDTLDASSGVTWTRRVWSDPDTYVNLGRTITSADDHRDFHVLIVTDYADQNGVNRASNMVISWRFSAEAFRRLLSKATTSTNSESTLVRYIKRGESGGPPNLMEPIL